MPQYTIESGSISLVAATPKTALQLVTGSTRRAKLIEIGVSFTSVTSSHAPGLVELRSQSTAGTSSAFTPGQADPAETAAISTALNTFTAEPTDVAQMYPGPWNVTPVGGLFVYTFPVTKIIAASSRVGLRLTFPDAQSGVRAYMIFEE